MSILLTKEGYKEYKQQIEKEKQKILEAGLIKREANEQAPGDGWHDNFLHEDATRLEKGAMHNIKTLVEKEKDIKIVNKHNKEDCVDIDDNLLIEFIYDVDDKETEELKLVGNYLPKDNEITLNSPLGKAIYNKKIGSTVDYKVNGKKINVNILKKL